MEYQEQFIGKNESISIGNWLLTMVLLCIPIVNIVMLLIWAFGKNTPISKSNFAKAALIIWAIAFLITLLFWNSISQFMMEEYYTMPV